MNGFTKEVIGFAVNVVSDQVAGWSDIAFFDRMPGWTSEYKTRVARVKRT